MEGQKSGWGRGVEGQGVAWSVQGMLLMFPAFAASPPFAFTQSIELEGGWRACAAFDTSSAQPGIGPVAVTQPSFQLDFFGAKGGLGQVAQVWSRL